jgi:hypothetical protein
VDFTDAVSNSQIAGADPQTPVFTAKAGTPVRFRVLQPGGHQRNHVFTVHGHAWQQEPYVCPGSSHGGVAGQCGPADLAGSKAIGDNKFSLWEGARMGHGPSNHFDAVLQNGAGGAFAVPGDYLIRDFASFLFDGGLWGILRVTP